MNKRVVVFVCLVFALLVTSCSPAASVDQSASSADQSAAVSSGSAPAQCASDAFGCAKIPAGQTIKIGTGAPMTGGDASFGIDITQGEQVAVDDTGEVDGFKFELIVEDDSGTAEGGAAVANKMVADPTVVAISGHIYSGATAAAMPIYEKAGVVMLSPSATNPPLTEMGSKVFNRIAFTDAAQGKYSAKYLYDKLGIRKLAIMHDGSDYGKGLAEIAKEEFTNLGGEVVSFSAITPKETDYTAPLAAVAATKPEALYYAGYTQESATIANQMKQTGLENTIFFGCDGSYGQDFLDRTGANGEDAYAVTLTPPDSEEKAKFDVAYEKAYGIQPGSLTPYTWNGYDATAALVAVIKTVAILGDDGNLYIPRGGLIDAVRTMKDYKGLTGTFTCDEKGECNASGPIFVQVKDGAWVPAP